jgi:hypothetical protein
LQPTEDLHHGFGRGESVVETKALSNLGGLLSRSVEVVFLLLLLKERKERVSRSVFQKSKIAVTCLPLFSPLKIILLQKVKNKQALNSITKFTQCFQFPISSAHLSA